MHGTSPKEIPSGKKAQFFGTLSVIYWSTVLTYPWVDLPIPALAFIVIYFKLQYAQNRERDRKSVEA